MEKPIPNEDSPPSPLSPVKRALVALRTMQAKLDAQERELAEPIAVIGIGCRFPGPAENPSRFWELLRQGGDAITEVPPGRWDMDALYAPDPDTPGKIYCRHGGFLKDPWSFDAHFFGITQREAGLMDPQQRMLLEVTWEAFEDAGQAMDQLRGSPTGVFLGISSSEHALQLSQELRLEEVDAYFGSGHSPCVAAGRLSYFFGFTGPSLAVDTACSSSLAAVHLACRSLKAGECQMAVAGGVNLLFAPLMTLAFSRAHMLSRSGRCRSFDAAADGYVRAEGCGALVLKRLRDAVRQGDPIYAVIRGSAVNQDGRSAGLTVPNGLAQQAVIRQALAQAGVRPEDVDYVEAHGTGTPLGDPIEIDALANVFANGREAGRPLWIGTTKSNLGHLEAAAGVAGLIKTLLAFQHHELPPNLHFDRPNPRIPWDRIPVEVVPHRRSWPSNGRLRVAGVSSFGFGGTNVHVVLADPPQLPPPADHAPWPWHLFTLSAHTEEAMRAYAGRMAQHLALQPGVRLEDLCFTTAFSRSHFPWRLALLTRSSMDLRQQLSSLHSNAAPAGILGARPPARARPGVVFLFPSAGSCSLPVARFLRDTQPGFAHAWQQCDEASRALGRGPILQSLDAGSGISVSPVDAAASLFAFEYSQACLWRAWGITPQAARGCGVGEAVASVIMGVMGLAEGLKLSLLHTESASPGVEAGQAVESGRLEERGGAGKDGIVLELGPKPRLANAGHDVLPSTRDEVSGPGSAVDQIWHEMLYCAGQLYLLGVELNRHALAGAVPVRRLHLPTYPFKREVIDGNGHECLKGTHSNLNGSYAVTSPPRHPSVRDSRGESGTRPVTEFIDGERALTVSAPGISRGSALKEFLATAPADQEAWLQRVLLQQLVRITQSEPGTIDLDGSLIDMGLDSLLVMEWVNQMHKEFDIMIYPREVYEMPTLTAFSRYLAAELNRAHGCQGAESTAVAIPARAPAAVAGSVPAPLPSAAVSAASHGGPKLPGIAFILSSPRSGSTLLRVMLAGHPQLFSPPELHLLAFASMSVRKRQLSGSHVDEGLQRALMELAAVDAAKARQMLDELEARDAPAREVYELLQRLAGTRLLVDKSPTYGLSPDILERAEDTFDQAKYIHLVRHPYSVIESYVRMRMQKLSGQTAGDPQRMAEQIWAATNRNIRDFGHRLAAGRYLQVSYEALVANPEGQTRRLCDFLNLPFDPAMLQPYAGQRMTDGVHSTSLPIGDPNFTKHGSIQADLADAWKGVRLSAPLAPPSRQLALEFGYILPDDNAQAGAASPLPADSPVLPAAPAAEMTERWVTTRGMRLCVCLWGPDSGPTIWLLHGLLEQGAAWRNVARLLAGFGYRVLAPDLRGHGLSDHSPPGCGYSLADFLGDFEGLTRALSPGSFVLAGHSMGSLIAALFASARADRVRHVVLVEPVLPSARAQTAVSEQLAAHLDHALAMPVHSVQTDLAAATSRLRQGIPALSEELATRLAARSSEPCEGGVKWCWDPRLQMRTTIGLAGNWLSRTDYADILRALGSRLTLVYGDPGLNRPEDRLDSTPGVDAARCVSIAGGHHLHFEAADALAEVILQAAQPKPPHGQ